MAFVAMVTLVAATVTLTMRLVTLFVVLLVPTVTTFVASSFEVVIDTAFVPITKLVNAKPLVRMVTAFVSMEILVPPRVVLVSTVIALVPTSAVSPFKETSETLV